MAHAVQSRIPARTLQSLDAWRRYRHVVVPAGMLLVLSAPDWTRRGEHDPAAVVVAVTLAIAVHGISTRADRRDGVPAGLQLAWGPAASLVAAAASVGVFALMARGANMLLQQMVMTFVEANVTLAVLHLLPVPPLAAGWVLLRVLANPLTNALFVRGVAGECLLVVLIVLPLVMPGLPAPVTMVVDTGQDFVLGVLGAVYRAL